MKKIITTICTLIILFSKVTAQDLQVVTLDKAGEMFSFYGGDAFVQAMEKADHGDIVTLSTGTFNSCDITKAVKIYGQGYRNTSTTSIQGITEINGDFSIAIDSTDNEPTKGLYIEGVYSSGIGYMKGHLTDAEFMNCKILYLESLGTSSDITIRKCIFGTLSLNNHDNTIIQNTGIRRLNPKDENSALFLLNCVVESCTIHDSDFPGWTTWRNCIIGQSSYSGKISYFPQKSSFYNCVYGYNNGINILGYSNCIDNCTMLKGYIDALFENMSIYTLNADAQSKYLGNDSTQVGMHGGDGFSVTPSIPQVVYRNVAPKTENDKLKVSLKVEIRPTDEKQ